MANRIQGIQRQAEHQEDRGRSTTRRDNPDRGRFERPDQLGLGHAQHQRSNRHHSEGEQRSDADEFADQPDRQESSENGRHNAGSDGRDIGGTKTGMNSARHRRQQPVMRHGAENSRLRQQHHQNDRSQAENDRQLYQRGKPAYSGGIDPDGDRIGDVQPIERHDPGQHKPDREIKHRTDRQRTQYADRQVPHRRLGLLRGGGDGVKPDIGKEHHGRATDHARPAVDADPRVWRNKRTSGIA